MNNAVTHKFKTYLKNIRNWLYCRERRDKELEEELLHLKRAETMWACIYIATSLGILFVMFAYFFVGVTISNRQLEYFQKKYPIPKEFYPVIPEKEKKS